MENLPILLAAGFGAVITSVIGLITWKTLFRNQHKGEFGEMLKIQQEKAALEARVDQTKGELERIQEFSRDLSEKHIRVEKELSTSEAERHNLDLKLKSQVEEMQKMQKDARLQFENLANRILHSNTQRFEESSKKNLGVLLDPLKQKIQDFEKKVAETYDKEARERFALKSELEKMLQANQQISDDANNLTRALKGDTKLQGNWGEIKLEMILERSGLREGEEYVSQGRDMKLKSEDGRHQKPDIVVKLPDDKHIILDSKVTLTAYERYVNEEIPERKEGHLKEFHVSLKKHIDELSEKHYQTLDKLHSPDFVFMFCPLEAAFSVAMQTNRDLFTYAWDRRIVVVSPTTLLATLRTVASIWKTERQNRNAVEIARQGGALYDKFAAFGDDLDKIGKNIQDTQKSYDSALNKLKTGRGNLITRAEKLRELGAKTSKEIDKGLLPEVEL